MYILLPSSDLFRVVSVKKLALASDKGERMYTLGINAVYHDSAACLVKDGQVIAAVDEEHSDRFILTHQPRRLL